MPHHIVITGASSGIGAALALEYAAPGIRLSLTARNAERLESVAQQARAKGAIVCTALLDITDASAIKNWLESCDSDTPIDTIIANAGISGGTSGGFEGLEAARMIFSVNLDGILNLIHPLIPAMQARQTGQIAIMASLAGFRGLAGAPAYCAVKGATRLYAEGLRALLASDGIKVSSICPGYVKTPMTDVNRFPMPFRISAEKAARIIRKGLARNQGRIAFPLPMYMLVRLFAAVPQLLLDMISSRLPRK